MTQIILLRHDHSSHGSHYLLSQHTKKKEDIEAKDPVCLMNFLFQDGQSLWGSLSRLPPRSH